MIKAGTGFVRPRFLPLHLVWTLPDGNGVCGCTCGMRAFGKRGMEALHADGGRTGARFSGQPGSYVPEYDVMLQDGETIGFSADKKYTITCSEGVSLPGMTLKISYDAAD